MAGEVIRAESLSKAYNTAAGPFQALKDVNLSILSGEFVAIMGPSGSGKSTFMNILGCLDRPSEGRYLLSGRNVAELGKDETAALRNRTIGFVFQGFNLLPRMALAPTIHDLFAFRFEHFAIEGYDPHPHIAAEVSV